MSARPLSAQSVRFRYAVIERLWDSDALGYLTEDRFIGTCPVCGAAIAVHFAGYAPRATLCCYGGCSEEEIAAELGWKVRP